MDANKQYKDTVFSALFGESQAFIELYNALTGSSYDLDTPAVNATLKNVLFISPYNDLAFIIDGKVVMLTEHQSSISPNMPIRLFLYLAPIYDQLIDRKTLYRKEKCMIPRPECVVLYNGKDPFPAAKTLKLSDLYIPSDYASLGGYLELEVRVININEGQNKDIVEASEKLKGYVTFISYIRQYLAFGMKLEEAIAQAVKDCIRENILVEFLEKYSTEVTGMLVQEFDMNTALEVRYEEGKQEGKLEKSLENAMAMLKEHLSLDIIARCTGLAFSEIETLRTAQ